MLYVGRPGISPALAALIALGRIQRNHRILDVGCGTGTDALALAGWGFRHIDAIDPDAASIGAAKGRATRAGLSKRVRFQHLGAEDLRQAFEPNTFDVVLHTLVSNNLRKDKDRHFEAIAAVTKPEGLLLLHERVAKRHENSPPGRWTPLVAARRHFSLGEGIATHLAEHPTGRRGPSYARVILWVGTRRR